MKIRLNIGIGLLALAIGLMGTALRLDYPASAVALDELPLPALPVSEETDEAAVYSAVINDFYLKDKPQIKRLLILNQTSFYGNQFEPSVFGDDFLNKLSAEQRASMMKEVFTEVSEETLLSYDEKQMNSRRLRPLLQIPVEFVLSDEVDDDSFDADRRIAFSSVGFNKTRTQAFVFTRSFRQLCGGSNSILLEKVNEKWQIRKVFEGARS